MLYWFWTPEILHDEKYLKDLKRIDEKSAYTMAVLSTREGMDFFDRSLIPHFEKAVSYAHRLGLKIVLQLWPEGSNSTIGISPDEAVSLVSEAEEKIPESGEVSLFCFTDSVRMKEIHTRLKSELLAVYAFKKMGDGKYAPGSLMELTNYAICHEADEGLSIRLSVPQWIAGACCLDRNGKLKPCLPCYKKSRSFWLFACWELRLYYVARWLCAYG